MSYDPPGSTCAKGAQPGAREFIGWTLDRYDHVGAFSLGIYNCRRVAGSTTLSLHAEGRACDIGFPQPSRTTGHPAGDALFDWLVVKAYAIGVQEVIFNRRQWSMKNPVVRAKSSAGSGPHLDHIHVGLNWDAAKYLTRSRLDAIAGSPSTPRPLETDMPKPKDVVAVVAGWGGNGYYTLEADGGVRAEDGAPFHGSFFSLPAEHQRLDTDEHFVGMAVRSSGYVLVTNKHDKYGFPA